MHIDRHFQCPVTQCGKTYGSEGSLNQHIKRKHKDHQINKEDLVPSIIGAPSSSSFQDEDFEPDQIIEGTEESGASDP